MFSALSPVGKTTSRRAFLFLGVNLMESLSEGIKTELYERYETWCAGNCLSRNTFVRRVQKIMGKFVDYKQKRVNGELILVFTGIEFSESDA